MESAALQHLYYLPGKRLNFSKLWANTKNTSAKH